LQTGHKIRKRHLRLTGYPQLLANHLKIGRFLGQILKVLIFMTNHAKMKLLKLTAFASILFITLLTFNSCQNDDEVAKTTDYNKTGIVMSGAQETPPVATTAIGSLDVAYSKETKMLTYKVTWSGLTGAPVAMHVHGLAPVSYPAVVVQTILSAPNATLFPASGTYSGSLLADGVVVKEVDILNGLYYVNIHTAAFPGGELRGQIKFQ
jgi:hypothetical protein